MRLETPRRSRSGWMGMEQRRQPLILLVEDDEDTRRVYAIMLRHHGFRVVEAANGLDAVTRASEEAPDLILMDMNLPQVDGWEAARRIKSLDGAAVIPLLAFSALVESIGDLRREAQIFDGFIAKPVSPSELVRRVSAYVKLVARPQAHPALRESASQGSQGGTAWQ